MNLLPQNEIKSLKRESTIRFVIVVSFLIIFLESLSLLMMVPSYFVVNMEKDLLSTGADQVKKTVSGNESLETELKTVSDEIHYFINEENSSKNNVTDVIKNILTLRPNGISSKSISIIQDGAGGGVVQLSGVGDSREALIEYQRVLSAQDFVKEAHYLEKFIMQKSDINYNLVISI